MTQQVAIDVPYGPDNASTEVGLCRLYLQDVDTTEPRWHDFELEAFLSLAAASNPISTEQKVYLAVSKAFLAEASDTSRVANILRLGPFGDNEKTVHDALILQHKLFLARAGVGFSVDVTDSLYAQVFPLDTDNDTSLGVLGVW